MALIKYSNDDYSTIYGLTFQEYKELKTLQKKLFAGAFALVIDSETESDPEYSRYLELASKKWDYIRNQVNQAK